MRTYSGRRFVEDSMFAAAAGSALLGFGHGLGLNSQIAKGESQASTTARGTWFNRSMNIPPLSTWTETFVDHDRARAMLTREYRAPFVVPGPAAV